MNDEYLLVNKAILPEVLPLVIKARDKIEKEGVSVSAACKALDISRSAYYKYKDMVFLPDRTKNRKAILSLKADDEKGVLNSILQELSSSGANVLTICQDNPIRGVAYITLQISLKALAVSLDEMLEELRKIKHVRKAEVIARE